jgi:formate-dependent nitrite reductase cytochrome c552 subunit
MWQHFVKKLELADGNPLWCDSCHQGRAAFLDRGDDDALAAWMNANFVGKLARSDGGQHACATCHGSPFDGHFLDAWQKGSVGG